MQHCYMWILTFHSFCLSRFLHLDTGDLSNLDVGHAGPTFTDTSRTARGKAVAAGKTCEGRGSDEGCEEEPEEGGGGLEFAAALAGALGERVRDEVSEVTTAVYMEFCSQNNSRNEVEDDGETLHSSNNEGVIESVHERSCEAVEDSYPIPDGYEYGVVDAGVAKGLSCNSVTDQSHSDQVEDGLETSQCELADRSHFCGFNIFLINRKREVIEGVYAIEKQWDDVEIV
jgi:hypothetical protein